MSKNNLNVLIDLIKNHGLTLMASNYADIDKSVKDALAKWLSDFNVPAEVPLVDQGLDMCVIAWLGHAERAFIFDYSYDGADTGTDGAGGSLVFTFDGTVSTLVLDTVVTGD